MFREYDILKKLKTEFGKVPHVHFYSDDKSILGAPFYVMDCVKGYILRPGTSQKNAPNPNTMSEIAHSLINTLVDLHQVDLSKNDLMNFGKIDGYVERQISGWTKRYYHAKTEEKRTIDVSINSNDIETFEGIENIDINQDGDNFDFYNANLTTYTASEGLSSNCSTTKI